MGVEVGLQIQKSSSSTDISRGKHRAEPLYRNTGGTLPETVPGLGALDIGPSPPRPRLGADHIGRAAGTEVGAVTNELNKRSP